MTVDGACLIEDSGTGIMTYELWSIMGREIR